LGQLADMRREEIRNWLKCIESDAGARYLIEILDQVDTGVEWSLVFWFRAGVGASAQSAAAAKFWHGRRFG
jgi:hypothetical protein